MIALLAWAGVGLLVGVLCRVIFPARAHGWKSRGIIFAVGGAFIANLLFSGNVFVTEPSSWVGVLCGSLTLIGYALLRRGEVTVRTRDVQGVPADLPKEAGGEQIVKHEPTPPRY